MGRKVVGWRRGVFVSNKRGMWAEQEQDADVEEDDEGVRRMSYPHCKGCTG